MGVGFDFDLYAYWSLHYLTFLATSTVQQPPSCCHLYQVREDLWNEGI